MSMITEKKGRNVHNMCINFFVFPFQVFNSRPNLTRHLTAVHGYRPPSPRKLKPRSPFYIKTMPLTRLARRLCQDLYNKVHHCRVPGAPLNIQEIRTQCICIDLRHFHPVIVDSNLNFIFRFKKT